MCVNVCFLNPKHFRLFNTFPKTRAIFKTLDGLSDDELRKSPKLKAHVINFKHGITSLVDNLDDVDCLTILIHKLTENHFRRNITAAQFQVGNNELHC